MTFETWFVKCIMCAMADKRVPGNYVWNLESPGADWLRWFAAGVEPEEAVRRFIVSIKTSLMSTIAGCMSGIACYERMLSGAREISGTTVELAALQGKDLREDIQSKICDLAERASLAAEALIAHEDPPSRKTMQKIGFYAAKHGIAH